MASPLSAVPRGSFAHHSKQLQTLRRAASTATPFPPGLFKPAASIIKPWKAVVGAQEWQSSAYHYNKQTIKTLPTASVTADKLLQDYSTMIKSRGPSLSSAASSTARTAIAVRRKSAEKMYVSGTTAKDYGDKIVINAFMFDGIEAAQEELEKKANARKASGGKQAGRKRPVRTAMGARRTGGTPGAPRSPGLQRATGAGR
ncbi:hypothetical protein LTR36_000397 [Oleoguttula mirabilis]|uniref:Uncharacterized protein n=1 Tax=Oleoguttula mirabilis TaxID=1507867 RepID=A0AAV9K045_9PEZI|nr:hypothetical protein LTR36_000397 [Oleoguttula mirabilis]